MKILVDEMPTKVENCPWSSPIKDPWKDRTFYWKKGVNYVFKR